MRDAKIIGFNAEVAQTQEDAKRIRQRTASAEAKCKHVHSRPDGFSTDTFASLKGVKGV